ncbi:MAG: SMP-30/gluconolactonase/LRE family protein [Pseudomonadota bacterium]|nr:SMP-30/gluconolactonase/LRE family protein [Pseudomonadota bacterium]MEE3070877.1 SMP-30/gluconolactonase/LRE family protein [Pseudomonadota bacterium]
MEHIASRRLGAITTAGRDLSRPESVLATARGDIFVSHKGYGVARILPDGRQYLLAGPTQIGGLPVVPNGIALRADGSFLVANISDAGGLLQLDADGLRPFHSCAASGPPPPVNFVTLDALGRIWFSVSSTCRPRHLAYRRDVRNGYVGVIDDKGMRIVLEGLHYTNEIRPDLASGWLYIAETFGQKITRVRLDERGLHGLPQTFATLPRGAFVDGIALDREGALLCACIVSNELIRVTPDGMWSILLTERDDAWVDQVEAALDAGTMGRVHFDTAPTWVLRNISSLAFAGDGLDRILCGNLLGGSLPALSIGIEGQAPLHWNVDVPLWGKAF